MAAADGHVANAREFGYGELTVLPSTSQTAVIDCTSGWYSHQDWSGVSLMDVAGAAGVREGAESVTVTGVTGYSRRFSMDEARTALLALRVHGETLQHEHGYPLRLVVPDHRGFDWVKWVTGITVNEHGDEWQAPLPY